MEILRNILNAKTGIIETIKETVKDKEIVINRQALTRELTMKLSSYKHEYITWVTYDNHPQRYTTDDKLMMLDCQQSLEAKLMPKVVWKYIDGYVEVTDPKYFVNMRLTGGIAVEKAFTVEKIITAELQTLTDLQLYEFDLEKRFDEIFKTL